MRKQLALICVISAATVHCQSNPAPKAKTKNLEPITINIGESSFSSSKSTPAAKVSTATQRTYRTTEQAESQYEEKVRNIGKDSPLGNAGAASAGVSAADLADAEAAKTVLEEKLLALKPSLINWRRVAEELNTKQGLLPDFVSQTELDKRVKIYNELAEESAKLKDALDKGLAEIENDLKDKHVSHPSRRVIIGEAANSFHSLKQRMDVAIQLSQVGVEALNILKEEWGNWRFSAARGLEFLSDFNQANKSKYNSLVNAYSSKFQQLQNMGGVE